MGRNPKNGTTLTIKLGEIRALAQFGRRATIWLVIWEAGWGYGWFSGCWRRVERGCWVRGTGHPVMDDAAFGPFGWALSGRWRPLVPSDPLSDAAGFPVSPARCGALRWRGLTTLFHRPAGDGVRDCGPGRFWAGQVQRFRYPATRTSNSSWRSNLGAGDEVGPRRALRG